MEWLFEILSGLASVGGRLGLILRLLGVKRLASAILARWRKVKAPGLHFYEDRATLDKERSWPDFISAVEEIDAMWVIGDKPLRARTHLQKIKRLLLPHPGSASIAFYAQISSQTNVADLIRQATADAQGRRIDVRWCREFLGYSLMLINKDLPDARVHIECSLPGIDPPNRPALVIWKKRYAKNFTSFRRAFDSLWENAERPQATLRLAPEISISLDPTYGGVRPRQMTDGTPSWWVQFVVTAATNAALIDCEARLMQVEMEQANGSYKLVENEPSLCIWSQDSTTKVTIPPGVPQSANLFAVLKSSPKTLLPQLASVPHDLQSAIQIQGKYKLQVSVTANNAQTKLGWFEFTWRGYDDISITMIK